MFDNRQELSTTIKTIMVEKNISILDAIIFICETYKIDEESIAAMIRQSHKLKEELREEALSLKLLKV